MAISNCTSILTYPNGPYKLSPSEASSAWADPTLYTKAESCPMCASAIRWAGSKEYVYGTSIERLIETGWGQIEIASSEVFRQSWNMEINTKYIPEMLTNETDPVLLWQFRRSILVQRLAIEIRGEVARALDGVDSSGAER